MYFNCHTWFSFGYGTLSPEALLDAALRCGVHKLVVTDINNTAAYIEVMRLIRERGLSMGFGVGVEFRDGDRILYMAIARNNAGFEAINRLLSRHQIEGIPLPERPGFSEDVMVVYPWPGPDPETLGGSEWIGVRPGMVNKIPTSSRRASIDKLTAWMPVTFQDKTGFNIHRLLRAIDHNTLLSKLAPGSQEDPDAIMYPYAEAEAFYDRYPSLIKNAYKISQEAGLTLALGTDKNLKTFTGSPESDRDYLITHAWEGFQRRYDSSNPVMRERFNRELEIIFQKHFTAYYLISHDVIAYARSQGFDYVGRGSGANSMVAYCLGITNVDPIALDLYFERFLNPERSSPPDFDLDFSWKDRDHVIRYMFERYGYEHTALLGTHTTYQYRSLIRELGKVFGLPKEEIDQIVAAPDRYRDRDHITRLVFTYAARMKDYPAHLSIHAGGVLITEAPIYTYSALAFPPKGFPVVNFEMHNAEDMGIYKFDILSQRGLGHIREAVNLIRENRGESVDIDDIDRFKQDPAVKELLMAGRTMGCFYVESPAMRMLLGKLQCSDYITLVAASSIIRPGVARSGMMRAYIERHHLVQNGLPYQSIHPRMDALMQETYGVMVYQEDVIKVAHHFAGLTLTDADVLRRGMSGKYRSRKSFERVKDRFFTLCRERGYPQEVTDRVWYEIESFAGYSFSKGHSASYAVESYQSLYLRAHYPLEFMVAVVNNFGGFYKTEFYLHEARMLGAEVAAPCVNNSDYLSNLKGKIIYLGFIHLKDLEKSLAFRMIQTRKEAGAFRSLEDFIRRVQPGLEQLRILIRIGAFRFTGISGQHLLWEAMLLMSAGQHKADVPPLFSEASEKPFGLPELNRHTLESAFDEIELLGFPLCDPFLLLATEERGDTSAAELMRRIGKRVTLVGYLVTTKDTRTKNGDLMHFGTFYDHEGAVFDTTHFPNTTRKYPFRGRGFYKIAGMVVEDFGVPMVEVQSMEKLPLVRKMALQGDGVF